MGAVDSDKEINFKQMNALAVVEIVVRLGRGGLSCF
jgi:hypothetical protein